MAVLKYYVIIESNMINAERCMQLCDVRAEEDEQDEEFDLAMRPLWPERGALEFVKVSARYRPNTDLVLKDIDFKI